MPTTLTTLWEFEMDYNKADKDLAQVALTAIFGLIDKAHNSGNMAHKRALMEVFGRLCDLTGNSNREAKV